MTTPLKLVLPSAQLEPGIRSLAEEMKSVDGSHTPFSVGYEMTNFDKYLQYLELNRLGEGKSKSFVPNTTYFAMVKNQVVGCSNIRHCLNASLAHGGGHIGFGVKPSARGQGYATAILAASVKLANEMGIDKVLLTCEKDNSASDKVIKNNGGVLDCDIVPSTSYENCNFYWIATS